MKHKAFLALCASMLLCSFAFSAEALGAKITSLVDLNVTDELRAKHPLKPHHEKLSFTCLDCHEGQGNDASKFKSIGDKGCMSCHGDKKKKKFKFGKLKYRSKVDQSKFGIFKM